MTIDPYTGGYSNPYDGYSAGGYLAPVAPAVEEIDEDKIDPSRFADVLVTGRFSEGHFGEKVDLAFGNLDLDDAADFFKYLATEDGQDELTRLLLSVFVERGELTPYPAIAILTDTD